MEQVVKEKHTPFGKFLNNQGLFHV